MMKSIHKVSFVAIIILLSGHTIGAQTDPADVQPAPTASIVTLLAEPVGKRPHRVQVPGFLVVEFEGDALYLHREDFQEGLRENAIRVSLTSKQEKQYREFSGSYVVVEATFQRSRYDELFTGSLFNVREIRKTLSRH